MKSPYPFLTSQGFAIIKSKLEEPHRHWHRYDKHIVPMLEQIERDKDWLYDPIVVTLATLTHDVVFSTVLSEHEHNETSSTSFFARTICSELIGVSREQYEAVIEHVIATRTHSLKDVLFLSEPRFEDLRYFLDLDILIFSQDFEKVLEFDSLIRTEFAHVPDYQFYPARREILHKFAAREEIYISERFKHLNPIAKENLSKLLTVLSLHG